MNQTRIGAIQKVESAYSFIKQQVDTFNSQEKKKRQRRNLMLRKGLTISTAALLIVVSAIPVKTIGAPEQQPEPQPTFDSSIKLDKQSTSLLVIDDQMIEIKPGKSLADQQAEEQARIQAARAAAQQSRTVATTKPKIESSTKTVTAASVDEAHQLAKEAAAKVGIGDNWKILASVWQAESGKAMYSCVVSKADGRAVGPMQFMPSTFRHYAAPGADICNARDALVAAATLLKNAGLDRGDVDSALFSYNHSTAYVSKIKKIANSIN